MVNFIGTMPDAGPLLALPGVHLHAYGKQARPGRKLGHATLRADNRQDLQVRLDQLFAPIEPKADPDPGKPPLARQFEVAAALGE